MQGDGNWTQEDIEEFMEQIEEDNHEFIVGGDDDDEVHVHPGAVMVGILLSAVLIYSIYIGELRFASLNAILLVVLALGSKSMS